MQYITLHYSTLHYITVQYITVHTCIGFGAQKSYVTRGAHVLSHQNLHTYITLHCKYNTLHPNIPIHFSFFSIFLIALKYCLYINRRKNMENHRFFLKYVFLKMGTSPKSSFFQRLAPGLRPNDGVVQRGNTIRKHNGENKTGNHRKKGKVKKTKLYFFNLFNCFKKLSIYKSKEKMEITDFFEICFLKMGTSPKSSFFQRLARGLRPKNGVAQRGTTSRCVSLLWFPLRYPVVGSKVLEPIVEKMMT